MEGGRVRHPPDATQTFLDDVSDCYKMGKRLRVNPPFREGQVRRYKRKCRVEAIRSLREPSATSGNNFVPESNVNPHREEYFDDSLVPVHPYGSAMDTFFHSWPSKVTMRAAGGQVQWNMKVSNHCPFCEQWGKVSSLKELVDHLDTHHPNFTYKASRNHNCATIYMKVNLARENNVDPIFIVGSEGYMLSSRKRKEAPGFEVPFEYGGYIPGAPGTVDAMLNYTQSKTSFDTVPVTQASRQKGIKAENTAISAPITKPFGSTHRSAIHQVNLKLRLRPPTQPISGSASNRGAFSSIRTPHRTAKRVALERKASKFDLEVATNKVEEELVRYDDVSQRKAKPERKRKVPYEVNPLKRLIRNDPEGMRNRHTTHMRTTMFGASARDRKAGVGEKPVISEEAADGYLFHTSTNIPLDVTRYNEEFDSDNDEEDAGFRTLLRHNELQLNEFVDVPSREKYFFTLWNRFVNQELTASNDKVFFPNLIRFVNKFGMRIRQMNLEVYLSLIVAHFWDLGLVDADGVMTVMQSFRDDNKELANYDCLPRQEKETTPDVDHLYQGLVGISLKRKTHSFANCPEECKEFGERQHVGGRTGTGVGRSDGWMATIFDAEKAAEERL